MPMAARIIAWRTIMFRSPGKSAPSASRIPNSSVRCSTEYAIRPYRPIEASRIAKNAKIPSSRVLNRFRAVDNEHDLVHAAEARDGQIGRILKRALNGAPPAKTVQPSSAPPTAAA